MRKTVLTDARLFHMGEVMVPPHRKKPPSHREGGEDEVTTIALLLDSI